MDKNKGNRVLTRPFLHGHLPVGNLHLVGKQVHTMSGHGATLPPRGKVVVEQDRGDYMTPTLGTSAGVNGKLQTVLVLTVQKGC